MTLHEKIVYFIEKMNYLNNPHVLGIFFYGSHFTGLNNNNSDIDLCIIFDNSDPTHLIRGNKIIDGTRIEYFEKTIDETYQIIENDYHHQNNASLLIFGKSNLFYSKDVQVKQLQQYVLNRFSSCLPCIDKEEAKEQVAILNNRMEKLKLYAYENNPYFEHLFHLTIDKIRKLYHRLMGISYLEASKAFKVYTDPKYKNAFSIEALPDNHFLEEYFKLILSTSLNNIEKYEMVEKLYKYTIKDIDLNPNEHRIKIKSKFLELNSPNLPNICIHERKSIPIPLDVSTKVNKFIKKMGYLNNPHCLGIFVYGSSLTGFNNKSSDIDLTVVFNNSKPHHLVRGLTIIDDTKIEYFEKALDEIYFLINDEYLNQNNASFSIYGNGAIVFERNNKLSELKEYTYNIYKTPMPPLNEDEAKEQVSILNNKIKKLELLATNNDPKFIHLFHLTINKIRKFYHKLLGISKIPTSKVYKIYTDKNYRDSMYKENPDDIFVRMYIELITLNSLDYFEMLNKLKEFYNYTIRNINLTPNYRIRIKSINQNFKKFPILGNEINNKISFQSSIKQKN